MRVLAPLDGATLTATCAGNEVFRKTLRFARPSEMITVDIPADRLPAPGPGTPPPLAFAVLPGGAPP